MWRVLACLSSDPTWALAYTLTRKSQNSSKRHIQTGCGSWRRHINAPARPLAPESACRLIREHQTRPIQRSLQSTIRRRSSCATMCRPT